ncbi:hypothetical protein BSKO_07137 [Bryopsis sp. KO-2023]|nr:hypothetical protein BSKO_07137 [Bryopsis sp. KO-2023]
MADLDTLLEKILNPSCTKADRMAAMDALVSVLGQQDRLREVLDGVCGRWRDITDLLWIESDLAMKTTASTMIARIGAVAIQYARLASSIIPPNILFSWIEPFLYNQSASPEQPWDETVVLFLLDILRIALSDLEGSAFKSSAPGLLTGCLSMLGSKTTPIGHFGALLEVLMQLAKVPTCVRPKFRDIVDLLVGWGVCADTPENARPKLARMFQSLSFGWDIHVDLAMSLVDGMCGDLSNLVTSTGAPDPKQQTEFVNTGICLASILESSCPHLTAATFETVPRIVDLYVHGLFKYTSMDTKGDSVRPFIKEICEQTKKLVSTIVSKGTMLSAQRNNNNASKLQPGPMVPEGKVWARGVCVSVLEAVHGKLSDVAVRPLAVVSVLAVHGALIEAFRLHVNLLDLEEKLRWLYGEHSVCFQLRFCRSKQVIQQTAAIYTTLLSWPPGVLRRSIRDLFLHDFRQTSTVIRTGFHALPLMPPPQPLDAFEEKDQSVPHKSPASSSKIDGSSSNSPPMSTASEGQPENQEEKDMPILTKRALFALTLFKRMVESDSMDSDDVQRLWDVLWMESFKEGGLLRHRKLVVRAVKTLRALFAWRQKKGVMDVSGVCLVMDYIGRLLGSSIAKGSMDLTISLLEWVGEVVTGSKFRVPLGFRLTELMLDLSRTTDERLRMAAGETIALSLLSCPGFPQDSLIRLSQSAAENASDLVPAVSNIYSRLLGLLAPYALSFASFGGVFQEGSLSEWSRIALQPHSRLFRPKQLSLFLKFICDTASSGPCSMNVLRDGSKKKTTAQHGLHDMEWTLSFLYSLLPAKGQRARGDQGSEFPLVEKPVTVETLTSGQSIMWFVIHEAARNLVSARFRTQDGGPSQVFSKLEEAVSETKTKVAEGSWVDLRQTWMLLEFISALEKNCFCGYEGSEMLSSPPTNTWQFYMGNRKVFVEWFARFRPNLLFISHKIGHHHYAAFVGMQRIHSLEAEYRNWKKVAAENESVDQQGNGQGDTQNQKEEAFTKIMHQLSETVMQTCLSMCRLQEACSIRGLHSHIVTAFSPALIPTDSRTSMSAASPIGYLRGLALQADGYFEQAILAYNEFYTYARSQGGSGTGHEELVLSRIVAKDFQPFARERIAECFAGTGDWRGYRSFLQVVEQQSRVTNGLWWRLRHIELSVVYDTGTLAEAVEKMSSWAQEGNFSGIDEVVELSDAITLKALLATRCATEQISIPDSNVPLYFSKIWNKLQPAIEILSQESPSDLSRHLISLQCVQCAHALSLAAQSNEPTTLSNRALTLFGVCEDSRRSNSERVLGVLEMMVPEMSGGFTVPHALSGLSADDMVKLIRLQRVAGHDLATLLLLGSYVARKKGNVRLATRLLNDETLQSVRPVWMKSLAVLENREILLKGGAKDGKAKLLGQWWESSMRVAQEASQETDSSKALLAISLVRLSKWFSPGVSESMVSLFKMDVPAIAAMLGDRWDQVIAASGGDSMETGASETEELLRARAACTATATHVSPRLPFVWREFGDTLHDIVQYGRDDPNSTGLDDTNRHLLGVRYTIIAYCKYLQLNGKAVDSSILLRLHQLVNLHGQFLLDNELERMLMTIPASAWTNVTPQLFMQLRHSAASVRKCMLQILKGVSSVAPSSVLYAAVVKKRQAEIDGELVSEELEALLTELHVQYPHLFNDLCVMLDEMERITVLWVEQWHATLAELHLDVHRRIVTFQAEMERLKNNDVLDTEQKQAMTQQRFATLFTPVILVLEKRLKFTLLREPETSNESGFKSAFVVGLTKAIARLRAAAVTDAAHIQKLWGPVRNLLKDMDKELKVLKLKMQDVSPKLMNLKDTEIPMPGYHVDNVTVCGFGEDVLVLSTKTRPKKLEMMGSDGQKHTYLLKGREDLHLDQRLMQFVSATNSMLQSDDQTGPQGLRARDYSVTPLGGRVGLIQWVSGTISMYGIFRSWQKHHQDKAQAVNAVKGDGPDGEARKAIKAPPAAQMRPTDLYYAHLFPELNKANIPRVSSSRKDWPLDLMLRVFHSLQDHIPKRLLANELWCGSSSASAWWHRAKKYSQSTAVMSIIGFMLGLGDRHLDNVLIDKFTAEVVHIDYDVCFDKGASFRIPEIVPFRMSQIMQVALGIGGLKGSFYRACADVLRVMRENKDGLWMLLESVLNDPTVDWAADRHERAARKGMDLAVNLQLFESRCEEVHGSIQLPRQRLLPALEATSNACRNAAELHNYMGDLLERMQTARQKTEEAKAVLSSAASDDQELIGRAKTAQERHDKYLGDLHAIQESVQQVLSHCHQWTFRHSRVLENLGDLSSPILVLPAQKWEARSTTTPIDLVQHSELFQGRTVLDNAFNGAFTTSNLPPEVLQNLQSLDHQGAQMLSVRDDLVMGVKASFQEYVAVRKHLLSEDYLSTSYHCSWMMVFQTALAATSADAVAGAQVLAPKEPSDVEVNGMWKVLTRSYQTVQSCLEKALEPPKVTPALVRVEQDAAARSSVVQKSLASEWGLDVVKQALQEVIAKLLEETRERSVQESESGGRSLAWQTGVDSATSWARKVFGLAQLFRLLRSSETGKSLLFGTEIIGEDRVLVETSTGYAWLDALEQYTSKVSLALRSFRHGALVDLTCFIEEGHSSMIESACDRMEAFYQDMKAVCQKAWTLEDMKIEQADFIATYDKEVTEVVQGLQEVNQRAANSTMTGMELQELATRQQMLTEHLQELQIRWEARDSVAAHLGQETEGLFRSIQTSIFNFVNEIKGIAQQKIEAENQHFTDDIHWGQMDFPIYRSFVEIFDLLESAEHELSPYMDQQGDAREGSNSESPSDERLREFPPSLARYTCHLEHCLWIKDLLTRGAKMRVETPEEDFGTHLDAIFLKGLSVRLQRVAGGLSHRELSQLLNFLASGRSPEVSVEGPGSSGAVVENGDNVLRDDIHGLGNGGVEFSDSGGADGDHAKPLEDGAEAASDRVKLPGDLPGMQVQEVVECCWACIDAQGLYAHSALLQRSNGVWTESMKNGQSVRLRNLAAFQWLHDDVIASGPNGASMQYPTYEYFRSLRIDGLPHHVLEKGIGRSHMLGALQNALHSLRQVQAGINEWSGQTTIASGQLYQSAHSYFLQKGGGEVTMQVLQGYLNHRTRWLESAMEHVDGIISLGHALLQFEYSRIGALWTPGEAPSSQSFSDFSGWLLQMEAAAEGLKAADLDIQECQAKATEMQIMTERATVMLQAMQSEDMDTSHSFSESTGILVQSAYDAAQKLDSMLEAVKASQLPIEKDLGPLLKELSSITNGHKATRDAHELVSRVLIEHSNTMETLPKLVSAGPKLTEKVYEIIKPVMSSQHEQNAEVDAGALYNQAAVSLVEDGSVLCSELEEVGSLCLQAFSYLSETYQALDYLSVATKSIAAALQSEHGLDEDAPDLDLQSEAVSPFDETEGTSVKEGTPSVSSDSDEEQWIAPESSAFHEPKDPSTIIATVQTDVENLGEPPQQDEKLTETGTRSDDHQDGNQQPTAKDPKDLPEAGPGTRTMPLGALGIGRNLGRKQTKMGRRMSQEQKGYVTSVSRRCLAKLEGREKEGSGPVASVEEQLEGLVKEATDPSNLCRMYEGWTSWI